MGTNSNDGSTCMVNKMSPISSWEECGFTLEITQDGSYSLKILSSLETSLENLQSNSEDRNSNYALESMHHSGGALTETMYIYAPLAILTIGQFYVNHLNHSHEQAQRVLLFCEELLLNTLSRSGASDEDKSFFTSVLKSENFNSKELSINHHLVVGLGLGYIECVITCVNFLFEKQNFVLKSPNIISIESYEIVEELKTALTKYLLDQPHFAKAYYEKVFVQVLEFFSIDLKYLSEIKKNLNYSLTLKSEMNIDSLADLQTYSALYFDAFSKKTSPALWTPEFLERLFFLSAKNSFFSTYACTGFLKRSLSAQGFAVKKRAGFKGKRDSTFALRFSIAD